ncbi:hypothetical protein SLA2020_024170 [Shorea laevis]
MSDYQSFCSNYHSSSQSRKISIGVMKRDKGDAVTATKETQKEAAEGGSSPWMITRSFYENPLASETAFSQRRNSSLVGTSTALQELNGVKDAPATYSVQFFSSQNTRLQDGDSRQKFKGMTYKRKGGKKDNSQRVEEFTFATAQGVHESDEVVMEEKTDKTESAKTETLKMKLLEILGTVSSPKGLHRNIHVPDVGPSNLKPEGTVDQIRDTTVKLRQNSDTTEMDAESPDNTIKRPETRSLTRKKAPSKVQPNETASTRKQVPKRVQPHKPRSGSSSKQKHQESFFCFGGQSAKLDGEVKRGSFNPGRKKIQKIPGIVPRKINFSTKDNEDDIQETSHRKRTPELLEKTSLFENDSLQPPVTNTMDKQVNFDNPTPENEDQQEDIGDPSKKKVVDLKDGFENPIFAIKTCILSPCPSSSPKTVQMEQGVAVPPHWKEDLQWEIFEDSRLSKLQEIDDAEKLTDSLPRNWISTTEKNDEENVLSDAASEEKDSESESSEGGSPVIKRFDSESGKNVEKPKFIRYSNKVFNNNEVARASGLNPTLHLSKGKLTSLCKLKRKHLETRLQGASKRQKAPHQKLLMQVKEAVEVQLGDAKRQIMGVHEPSLLKKMLQLKCVIAEFLREGI